MGKKRNAAPPGVVTLSALGIIMASIVDVMRFCDVPNDAAHFFLDQLEEGFTHVLTDEPQAIMLTLVTIVRQNVASND